MINHSKIDGCFYEGLCDLFATDLPLLPPLPEYTAFLGIDRAENFHLEAK